MPVEPQLEAAKPQIARNIGNGSFASLWGRPVLADCVAKVVLRKVSKILRAAGAVFV